MEDLLPVGSIVELKDKRRLMIIGYLPSKPNDKEFYDYMCCNSLIGIRKPKEDLKENQDYYYINQEDIESVLYIGCQDMEFELDKMINKKTKDKLQEVRSQNKELTNEELENIYSGIFEDLYKDLNNRMKEAKKAKEKEENKNEE